MCVWWWWGGLCCGRAIDRTRVKKLKQNRDKGKEELLAEIEESKVKQNIHYTDLQVRAVFLYVCLLRKSNMRLIVCNMSGPSFGGALESITPVLAGL